MIRISKEWIKNNVANIIDSNDSSRLKNRIRTPRGGFETNLSPEQMTEAERDRIDFKIMIPGNGWCDAQTYSANNRPKTWYPLCGHSYGMMR